MDDLLQVMTLLCESDDAGTSVAGVGGELR